MYHEEEVFVLSPGQKPATYHISQFGGLEKNGSSHFS